MGDAKQRHGCLTAWLVLMIIANSLVALMYLFASRAIMQKWPNAPVWAWPLLTVLSLGNVVCSVALFQWKKWGFFGFVGTSILTLVVNLTIGVKIAQALLGVLGAAILYGVLQIGKEKKGWTQLE